MLYGTVNNCGALDQAQISDENLTGPAEQRILNNEYS
jgi:hypothetical protein